MTPRQELAVEIDNVQKELRSLQPRREPLAQAARQMREGTYDYPFLGGVLRQELTREEALIVWDDIGKKDRNATFSNMIDLSIYHALALRPERPPYGLVQIIDEKVVIVDDLGRYPFEAIKYGMRQTVKLSKKTEEERLAEQAELDPESIDGKLFRNYTEWLTFEVVNFPERTGNRIKDAIDNATTLMSQAAAAIPTRYRRDICPDMSIENMIEVADNTDEFMHGIASYDLVTFLGIRNGFSSRYGSDVLPPEMFVTEESRYEEGRFSLELQPSIYRSAIQIAQSGDRPAKIARTVRTDCPAKVSFQKKPSAILALWQWHKDIARDVYTQAGYAE